MTSLKNSICRGIHLFRQANFKFELWQVLLSLLITAGSSAIILDQVISSGFFSLHNFNDRTIGIVIFTATDASHRTDFYVFIWIYAFFILCSSILILAYVNEKKLKPLSFKLEKDLLFYLSLFSLVELFLYALSQKTIFISMLKIFVLLLCLVGFLIVLKLYAIKQKNHSFLELFSTSGIITLSFVVPYICVFVFWILFDQPFLYSDIHLFFYGVLWAIFIAGYYTVSKYLERKNVHPQRTEGLLIKSILPLVLIPPIVPLSNELQYTLSGSYHILPNTLAKFLVLILMVISVCIFTYSIKRPGEPVNGSSYIIFYYFPLIIISIGLFHYYREFLTMGKYDVFHHGEWLISTQQLFVFHNLPFVNNFPTHGLNDMSYQILYSLVNGYTPIQSLIWYWIPVLFGMVILYFVLSKLTSPVFAFLICLFVPVFGMISSLEQYLFCLLPVFTLCWLIKKPDFFRFCVHWMMILFLFIWRLDFGAATFAGTVFILMVILVKETIYAKNIAFPFFKIAAKSFLCIFGIVFISYCILLFVCNQNIVDTILVNIKICTYQAPVQAFSTFFSTLSFMVILEYVIFPIVALIFVISFVFDQLVHNKNNSEARMILAFLAVTVLALSIRSVQRHSMVVEFNPILFPLLLVLLPLNFEIRKKQIQTLVITLIFLIYIITVPTFGTIFPGENTKLFNYHNWTDKENRIIDDQSSYKNITRFLKSTIISDETFYDFSNAPLLYTFTNKEFIPYLIPNIYQSSEIIQKDTLNKFKNNYQQGRVPVVIFKQGNGWDYVDEVPNEIRSYRIAEYIYQHYKPIGNIDDKYQIWVAGNIDETRIPLFEKQPGFRKLTSISQTFNLQKLPYIWGTFDPMGATDKTLILENVTKGPVVIRKNTVYSYSIHPDFDKTSGNYLYLKINGSRSSNITIKYGTGNANNFVFTTIPSTKNENYLVRTSTQWEWLNSNVEKISITSDGNFELSEMNIRKGD